MGILRRSCQDEGGIPGVPSYLPMSDIFKYPALETALPFQAVTPYELRIDFFCEWVHS